MVMLPDEEEDKLRYLQGLNASYPELAGGSLPVAPGTPPKVSDVVEPAAEGAPPEEAQESAPEEAAETPSAAPAAPAAPAAQPAPWYASFSQKETAPELKSTRPDWYKDKAPPSNTAENVLAPLLTGGLGAMFSLAGGPKKYREANALAAGLGGVTGAIAGGLGSARDNYQTRLAAADKQSDMYAKMGGRGTSGGLGWANLDLQERKFAHALTNEAEKKKFEAALTDINSPETKSFQQALIAAGYPAEKASKMTGAQIRQFRAQFGQEAQRDWSGDQRLTDFNRRRDASYEDWVRNRGASLEDFEREQAAKIGGEEREQTKLNEQAAIPGYTYTGPRAPNIAAVEKARVLADNTETAELSATKLQEIWEQLSTQAQLTPSWAEGALPREMRELVNDMRAWGLNLDTAQRNLANMGVPQQFEMAIVRSISPDATGVRAFLNDATAWGAQARVLRQLADSRMRKYGYAKEGSEPAVQPHKKQDKPLPAKIKEAGQAMGDTTNQLIGAGKEVLNNAAGTAKKVVGAVKGDNAPDTDIGEFDVTQSDGQVKRKRLTQKQYDLLEGAKFPMKPVTR